MIDAKDKPSVLASGNIYVAPNTGGESFGIVLLEAMASGTPVVASDLEAFARVLDAGRAGRLFVNENSESLASVICATLRDVAELARLHSEGLKRAQEFDWATVAKRIETVYESVHRPGVIVEPDFAGQMLGRIGSARNSRGSES
jgi:phosphatidylinositol alpha-mannosyltransferase